MIKILPKLFMINSLFCLRQHFSAMTFLIFIQNFGNCSFACNNQTVYCPRIHYNLFKSNWVLPSKYQKIMVSLLFIFCWCMHIFLMIQISTEKRFISNFWTTDHLNMVDPSFSSFLRDLHRDNTLVASKYTKNLKWGWMGLNDATWHFLLLSTRMGKNKKIIRSFVKSLIATSAYLLYNCNSKRKTWQVFFGR